MLVRKIGDAGRGVERLGSADAQLARRPELVGTARVFPGDSLTFAFVKVGAGGDRTTVYEEQSLVTEGGLLYEKLNRFT